jgi:hypothetical protein
MYIYVVCKHSDGRGGLDIYMSIHPFLRSKCGLHVLFVLMLMMLILSICCDRIYVMFMYV